jgi:orotidine-5'-phosphate decarboxylase
MMAAALEGAAKAVSLHPSLHIPLIIAVTQLPAPARK